MFCVKLDDQSRSHKNQFRLARVPVSVFRVYFVIMNYLNHFKTSSSRMQLFHNDRWIKISNCAKTVRPHHRLGMRDHLCGALGRSGISRERWRNLTMAHTLAAARQRARHDVLCRTGHEEYRDQISVPTVAPCSGSQSFYGRTMSLISSFWMNFTKCVNFVINSSEPTSNS